VAGAVNVIGLAVVLESVPQLADQVTAVFTAFATVAVNFCLAPAIRMGDAGATVTRTGTGTATVAVARFVGSATEVTVTVQLPTVTGAVNVTGLPVVADNFPQLAVQVTAVLAEFVTATLNFWVPPATRLAEVGVNVTVMGTATVPVAEALWSRRPARSPSPCNCLPWREL